MISVVSAIRDTIPISMFNRGLAGKIFSDVRQSGAKVVMKNNAPEVVLLSPDEYIRLMDEVNDARLLVMASRRMEGYDPAKTLTMDEVNESLGITDSDLSDFNEVEFE